ncbi:MAG TPA: TIR domain-containing protein, partial [Candidatus Synoicihabitans sp.]|nr:TIR domain-containing protein [Candidatus Synoicihabitans sp.]
MARVFISYRHDVADTTVARRIYERLVSDNHEVFLDFEKLRVGDRWNAKIQKELDEAEFFIALVSLSYLHSTFILKHELVPAAKRLRSGSLKGFLHVNLAYAGNPPAVVRDVLTAIQDVKWASPDDTPRVVEQIASKLPPPDLLIRGAQSFSEADERVFKRLRRTKKIEEFLAVHQTGSHILLRGVSGAGKTSFLKAGVVPALKAGVAPVLRPSQVSVVELKEDSAGELERVCASQPDVVIFDQFEQSLIRLAHDAERCAALDRALVAVGKHVRTVFCIREEFRTAFEELLPETESLCTSFLLQPFAPSEAVAVLEELLKNGGIEFDATYLPALCESLSEGVPRAVVPAILQVIAQQCRIRNLALNSATWQRLVRGQERTIFEEHVSESVLAQLPFRIPRLSATRTLVALTHMDVKSEFKTVSQIAEDQGVTMTAVQQTLDVAAGRARVVSIDSFTADDEPRYRL